jgi:hypothetical protein
LKRVLLTAAILVALPYLRAPVYQFPVSRPFTGRTFLNPYAETGGTWQRANLHAHGIAWGGLTNGHQPGEEIVSRYNSLGYQVAGVSDYQRIAAHRGVPTIPLYEHGYNIGKLHQLAIGARRVAWFDLPLWQSRSHRQFVIDQVAATADLVALVHPASRYSPEDMAQLTGYHLIEILNGPHPALEVWDAALSSGHVVWGIGNDDTHDLNEPGRTAAAWTMIDAQSPSEEHIVDALRAGRSYVVWRHAERASPVETRLANVTFERGVFRVECVGEPSTIEFIGQNGATRKAASDTLSASYTFTDEDTYIRAVVWSPRTVMFLNPVLRHDGSRAEQEQASVDVFATWVWRGSLAFFAFVAAALHFGRRVRVPVGRPAPQLTVERQDGA